MITAVARASGLVLATLVLIGAPATGQLVDEPGALQLAGQTSSLRPGAAFDVELRVAGPGTLRTVQIEIYGAVGSRLEFLAGLSDGADLGQPIFATDPMALADGRDSDTDLVSVRVPTSRADRPRVDTAVIDAGVHPVRVVLAEPDGQITDEVITHLLALPDHDADTFALVVAPLARIAASVSLQPDQQLVVTESTRTSITSWADALTVHGDTPATLQVPGETINALFRAGTDSELAALAALAGAAPGRAFINDTYVSIDEEAWRGSSLEAQVAPLREADRTALERHLGATVDEATRVVSPTDSEPTLAWLAELGIQRLLVPADRLEPLDTGAFPLTLTQLFALNDLPAVTIDAVLGSHFGATGNAVLDGHRVLADLTVLALDQPGIERGVVLSPPVDWTPDATTLSTVFAGLDRSQVLDPALVSDLFAQVPVADEGGNAPRTELRGEPLERTLTNGEEPASLGTYPAELAALEADLTSFESAIGPTSPLAVPLRDLLQVSGSDRFDIAARNGYLDAVRAEIRPLRSAVRTLASQSISLTAREADIPVALDNAMAVPIRVDLLLESDKLEFPGGDRITVDLEPGETTVEIPVRARTSGDAALNITPRTPDGRLQVGATSRVTVRSTVLSGLGVVISAIALAVLLTWWGRQVWARRRSP